MKNLDRFLANLKRLNLTSDNLNPKSTNEIVTYTCLTCGYKKKDKVKKIVYDLTGCAKCAGVAKYTDKEIEEFINKYTSLIK